MPVLGRLFASTEQVDDAGPVGLALLGDRYT